MTTPPLPEPSEPFELPPPRTGGWLGAVAVGLAAAATLATWTAAWMSSAGIGVPVILVPVLAFLPYVAVALLVVSFTVWTLVPDRVLAMVTVAAATVGPLVQWGPSWAAHPDPDVGTPVRVMSWNVRRLWGDPEDEADATGCVIDAITETNPDAVVLLEVTQHDIARLSETLDLDCTWGTYRRRDHTDASGVAACSHGSAWRRQDGQVLTYTEADDWQFVTSSLSDGAHTLVLMGAHLSPYQLLDRPMERAMGAASRLPVVAASQSRQTATLAAFAEATDGPVVLAGDFNSSRDTPPHASLRRILRDTWEVGASGMVGTVRIGGWLPVRIDHIYASPDLGIVHTEVHETTCSDHRALVTDLRVQP